MPGWSKSAIADSAQFASEVPNSVEGITTAVTLVSGAAGFPVSSPALKAGIYEAILEVIDRDGAAAVPDGGIFLQYPAAGDIYHTRMINGHAKIGPIAVLVAADGDQLTISKTTGSIWIAANMLGIVTLYLRKIR